MNEVECEAMNAALQELAKLHPMEYDAQRDEKAKELGVRVATLDKEVVKRRIADAEELADNVVEELSPWPEPVDGDELLTQIKCQLMLYAVMQEGCPTTAATWALASFCMDAFRVFPKLQLKSPSKRCGKTTLMECLEGVTCRALMTSNITAAALFRCIEAWRPTLLIDEADTFAKDNDELNGIINAGHTRRTAFVIRTVKVNDDHQPKKFCVWGAQVIAGIKDQRDTLEDRSVTILMRRRKPGERVRKIPIDYYEQNTNIRRQCLRWAGDNAKALEASQVEVPNCGNDRAQDNWSPLFAIAALAGGRWPEWIKAAYLNIEVNEKDMDDSVSTMLLADIKSIFEDNGQQRIHSENLVNDLVAMDSRPWAEWKRGFPMTKTSLSRLLKPYQIKPKKIRIGQINVRGYERTDFQDAFDRYLAPVPPLQSGTTEQINENNGIGQFQSGTQRVSVPLENPEKSNENNECSAVPLQNGVYG